MIEARDVSFSYGTQAVLAGIALSTRPGAMFGLIGPNGSGKSTLLRCLHGSLVPRGGSVLVDGTGLVDLSAREIARRVAVVPQESPGVLGLTAVEVVLLGRAPHRRDYQGWSPEDRRIVAEALEHVGVLHLADRRLGELSGGERQRVAIARCLAQRTKTLLLDEPTNHLDIRYQHDVLRLIRSLGLATVVVLHDLNLAARYCDDVALLHGHRIVRTGPVDEVLRPEVLEPVYGIAVRRIDDGGKAHLIFG